jgi:HD domain
VLQPHTIIVFGMNNLSIGCIRIPDSKLAQAATELVRDTESDLLFHHSTRVYYFGALAGQRQNLKFDSELLYIGAMFHDMGLTKEYSSATERFEVDSANAARDFLRQAALMKGPLRSSGTLFPYTLRQAFPSTKSRK